MSHLWGEEEDNNPYGSYHRRDSTSSVEDRPSSPVIDYTGAATLPQEEGPPPFLGTNLHPSQIEHVEEEQQREPVKYAPKKDGYDSRVEQILYEHPELDITITFAGKNVEGGGSYIAYTIRTGDVEVRRRYRDFASLRDTLVSLHPTLIIPPIPEKHSLADYAAKPTKAKEDEQVIDHRKRMLTSFLNRCRRMQEVREDGVYWKFLDPNASWSEVLHSHPVSSLPKNILKAPPLDPANPTPGHTYLPIPSSTAKLKSQKDGKSLEPSGTPNVPTAASAYPSAAAHTTPGPQIFGRFPPAGSQLSETELDPYFVSYENSSRELEALLQGSMEKVNRRTLSHLNTMAEDMSELGARLNGFSLSEQSATLAAAIEKVGQAVDSTYIATGDMTASLSANFSDPMRESAQFAGIVRNVLRYRILKRIQGEMAKDDLEKKRTLLTQLEGSEMEAQRIEQHLERSGFMPANAPRRPNSARSSSERTRVEEDTASIDSDFPPNHGESRSAPSASQGLPPRSEPTSPQKKSGGNFVTNKIFGRINHAIHGIVDVDPERTRRDQIGKTKESLVQLEQAIDVSDKDVKDASAGVLKNLKQFQTEKEDDLRRYMIAYSRVHIEWAKRNLASWEEAKREVEKIGGRLLISLLVATSCAALSRCIHTSDLRRLLLTLSRSPPTLSSPPDLKPSFSAVGAASQAARFTTSSSKKVKVRHTYGSARRGSLSKSLESFGSSDDQPTSPRSPPQPSTSSRPSPAPLTPRFIPPHLHDEVLNPPATPRRNSHGQSPGSSSMIGSGQDEEGITYDGISDAHSHRPASVSGGEAGYRQQLGVGGRAASPAKRSASERDEGELEPGYQQLASPMPNRFKNPMSDTKGSALSARSSSNTASDDSVPGTDARSLTPPTSVSGQAMDDEVAMTSDSAPNPSIPSYDDQIRTITEITQDPSNQREGIKGFAVSSKWIQRVVARTSEGNKVNDKSAKEGEVGPVNNSDIIAQDDFNPDLKDTAGNLFVPLREGAAMSTDFEIVPLRAWDLIVSWYGLAKLSPPIIRYMHQTAVEDAAGENLQYELFPPVCTVQKLKTSSASPDTGTRAPTVVTSRSENFQRFLMRAKSAADVDMAVKVKVWQVLETGLTTEKASNMPTPTSSRAPSPALQPESSKGAPQLTVDLTLEEGSNLTILDFKDETANENYNGNLKVDTVGLPSRCTLILEQVARKSDHERFASDDLSKTANKNGVDPKALSKDGSLSVSKGQDSASSGRRSPTPSGGIMTRGRATKKGRSKGNTGLTNLGNTCYMNSALQCIRAVDELTIYFLAKKWQDDMNDDNPLGHGGAIAKAYKEFLVSMYERSSGGSYAPRSFKATLGRCQPLFSGYGQQDSQEFLSFLVDGLHEDLNRIRKKPYIENPESDDKTVHDPEAIKALGEQYRKNHHARNDSVAMDLFNGFYKNTMVCPQCERVSVTFDPYSLLTLQLPVEMPFQHTFTVAPLYGHPFSVEVDIDKNSSLKSVKEYLANRANINAKRLILAEEYGQRFYQVFVDTQIVSESNLQLNDHLWAYEIDDIPTNWPPPPKKKAQSSHSMFGNPQATVKIIPDMSDEMADRMAIPLIHRTTSSRGSFPYTLLPSFILVTREEAKDMDKILRKVLQKVQTMTSRRIFDDDNGTPPQGSSEDSAVMEEDEISADGVQVNTRSIESEDDLVDVTMTGTAEPNLLERDTSAARVLDPEYYIFPDHRRLFEMKIWSHAGHLIPSGMNHPGETARCPTIASRIAQQPSQESSRRPSNASWASRRGSTSTDELTESLEQPRTTPPESDDEGIAMAPSVPFRRPGQLKSVKKNKRRQSPTNPDDEYLIRLGEGILLEWSDWGYDALFSGGEGQGSRRDAPTQTLQDPKLDEKKAVRAARKKDGVTLEECFLETSKAEVLSEDNAWYCSKCKERHRATKQLEIWTVPDILVVHLKRFSAQSRLRDKIDVLVDFPVDGLNLEGKVGMPEGKSLLYDLIAVDNHYGGLGGGHYTAFAQTGEGDERCWYEYNDQMVNQRNPKDVVTRAAYLLFYRRRQDKPLGGKLLEDVVNEYSSSSLPTGEDLRPDDSSSNGSSDGLLGVKAGLAANHQQGAQTKLGLTPFPYNEGGSVSGVRSPKESDMLPSYQSLPAYDDPDNVLPGIEDGGSRQGFIGPSNSATWNFDNIAEGRPNSPAGSDGSMVNNNDGDMEDDYRMNDFPERGNMHFDHEDDEFEDVGGGNVQHVSVHDDQMDQAEDEKVIDITLTSDEEV